MERSPALVALLLLVAAAGCADPPQDPQGEAPPAPPPGTKLQPLPCPRGNTWEPSAGACVGVIGGAWGDFGEPDVAIHPAKPSTWAIASVANVAEPRRSEPAPTPVIGPILNSTPTRTPCAGWNLCLFFTEDAGVTWANAKIPALPGRLAGFDAQLVFDSKGILHVMTLTFDSKNDTGEVQYLRTPDGGRTWSTPRTLHKDPKPDRPWLVLGPSDSLAATWVEGGGGSVRFAASTDGGSTWSEPDAVACRWPSSPARTATGTWIFLCSVTSDAAPSLNTYEVRDGKIGIIGAQPAFYMFPGLAVLGDGSLVSVTSPRGPGGELSLTLRWSSDEGRTWPRAIDLRKASPEIQALRFHCLTASSLGPDGLLHVLIAGIGSVSQAGKLCLPTGTPRTTLHIVADASTGALHGVHVLGTPDLHPPEPARRGTSPANDDFHDITWTGNQGLLAYSHEGVLGYGALAAKG